MLRPRWLLLSGFPILSFALAELSFYQTEPLDKVLTSPPNAWRITFPSERLFLSHFFLPFLCLSPHCKAKVGNNGVIFSPNFRRHCFSQKCGVGDPPVIPKRISWARDSAATQDAWMSLQGCSSFSVSWAPYSRTAVEESSLPPPQKESLSCTSSATEVLFCQYNGPWDVKS